MYNCESRNKDNCHASDDWDICCNSLLALRCMRGTNGVWIQITPDPTFPANSVIPYRGNEESSSADSCRNGGGVNQSDYMFILQQIRPRFTKMVNS